MLQQEGEGRLEELREAVANKVRVPGGFRLPRLLLTLFVAFFHPHISGIVTALDSAGFVPLSPLHLMAEKILSACSESCPLWPFFSLVPLVHGVLSLLALVYSVMRFCWHNRRGQLKPCLKWPCKCPILERRHTICKYMYVVDVVVSSALLVSYLFVFSSLWVIQLQPILPFRKAAFYQTNLQNHPIFLQSIFQTRDSLLKLLENWFEVFCTTVRRCSRILKNLQDFALSINEDSV